MTENTRCIRCGKMRIEGKSWTEVVNSSKITYTQTVCPDPKCQKIVDLELEKKMEKVRQIQQKSLERRNLVKKNRKSAKNLIISN